MSFTRYRLVPFLTLGFIAAAYGQGGATAELTYLGRASVKIKTAHGLVVYIDPYAPGDYSEPADLILVTHGHSDHNRTGLVAKKPSTVIVAPVGAVSDKAARAAAVGATFSVGSLSVRALPAANANHDRADSRGYLVSFDGVVVYHAGDTDYLPEMASYGTYDIDYALLPCDGYYNMGPDEASRCAEAMKAKRVIPIHSSKSGAYDQKNAEALRVEHLIALKPGQKTTLEP